MVTLESVGFLKNNCIIAPLTYYVNRQLKIYCDFFA